MINNNIIRRFLYPTNYDAKNYLTINNYLLSYDKFYFKLNNFDFSI